MDDLVTETGEDATSDSDKAMVLADSYSEVLCWDEDPSDVPCLNSTCEGPLLETPRVTPGPVEAKLCDLRPTASPGPERVHPKVLRELASSLSLPLTDLFNHMLEAGQVPIEWKKGQVVTISRRGTHQPIQLLSCQLDFSNN